MKPKLTHINLFALAFLAMLGTKLNAQVRPPQVTAGSSCGYGNVSLKASGAFSDTAYRWYANATGGAVLKKDSSFTTPYLRNSATWYVAVDSLGTESVRVPVTATIKKAPANVGFAAWPKDSLKVYYKFDGNAADSSGNGLDAFALRTIDTTDRFGRPNSAYYFNGINAVVSRQFRFTAEWSGVIWFKTNTTTGGKLFGWGDKGGDTSSGGYDRHLYMTNRGTLACGMWNGPKAESPLAYNDNQWHMAAFTANANGIKLYLDNVLAISVVQGTPGSTRGWLKIGFDNLNSWPSQPSNTHFTGTLDDFRFYSREISASEVAALYNPLGIGFIRSNSIFCGTSANAFVKLVKSQIGVKYQWADSAGTTPIGVAQFGTDDTLTFSTGNLTNSATFRLTAMDTASGCRILLDSVLTVKLYPVPAAATVRDTSVCGGSSFTLKSDGALAGGQYRWYLTDTSARPIAQAGRVVTLPNLTVTTSPTATKADTVTRFVSIYGAGGCEGPRTKVQVIANTTPPKPTFTPTGNSVSFCPGDSVQLTAPTGLGTYNWFRGATLLSSTTNTVWAATAGAYTLVVKNAAGCASQPSTALNVTAAPKPNKPTLAYANTGGLRKITATFTPPTPAPTCIWFLNDTLLTGQTTAVVNNPRRGTYKLVAKNAQGCKSDTAVLVIAGLKQLALAEQINLYPNPNNGNFQVNLDAFANAELEIKVSDFLGRTIYENTLLASEPNRVPELDLTGHSPGLYHISIRSAAGLVTKTFQIK